MGTAERRDGNGRGLADVDVVAHAANYFECAPSWQLAERTRPNYQLWLITSGQATFTFARGVRADVAANSALLIPPDALHKTVHRPARPLHCFVIHFIGRRYGRPTTLPWPTSRTAEISAKFWNILLDSADELCREFKDPTPESDLLTTAAITRLLGLTQRAARSGGARYHQLGATPGIPRAISIVLEYISRHYASEIGLEDLSKEAGLSDGYLNYLFRKTIGISPVQYIRKYRIDQAKYLLGETDHSIKQIGVQVGYPDAFYFSRVFRQVEGLPPSQYRHVRLDREA